MTTTTPHSDRTPTDAARTSTWRLLASLAGPALLALVGFITPVDDTDEPADRLADIFAHEGRYTATLLCLAGGMMLLVPAVLAIRDLAPWAARRAATVGAVIAATGFMCFVIASGALGFAPSAWSTLPEAPRTDLLPAFVAMDEGQGALGLVLVGAPLLPLIGLTVLAVALWRLRDLPRLALVALPLGWAMFLFAPVNPMKSLGALVLAGGIAMLLRHGRVPRSAPYSTQ
ncbi:MAG: hypothetical protein ACRD0G_08885 [Acidimicrobiales bacterium]